MGNPPNRTSSTPRAILFDMDGTLTRPMLDFPAIKLEMSIGTAPILESLKRMAPSARTRAQAILSRHEKSAAEASPLNEGCRALLDWLRDRQIATALITRNSLISTTAVLQKHALTFPVVLTREDTPHKPNPAPLLTACQRLGISPADAWMVGDGSYDIEAGNAAAISTVWISHGQPRPFAAMPWRTIDALADLRQLIEEHS